MNYTIHTGDCIASMNAMPEKSVHCCVTSPPYFGLRDYGHDGQIGLEETPEDYVAKLIEVFRAVRRVLRDDGTLWLNLGDSYATQGGPHGGRSDNQRGVGAKRTHDSGGGDKQGRRAPDGLKPKDLIGIPWLLAFALRADGWYLRQDIIWHKPNPMPESVRDRCTKAHEYIFLLSKSERYFYDADSAREPAVQAGRVRNDKIGDNKGDDVHHSPGGRSTGSDTRNRRSVWTVATRPYKGAHFATFPPDLIRPCIQAGCPKGGTVLDPFGGSGTTAQVAIEEGRNAVLCELNPAYVELAHQRVQSAQPKLL